MEQGNLLNLLIFIPVIGAVLCLIMPNTRLVKIIAVATTVVVMLLSLMLFQHFAWWGGHDSAGVFGSGYGQKLYQVTQKDWIRLNDKSAIQYFVGVDGLSFPLVILTTVVSFLACLASWNIETWKINKGIRGYFALFLLLETGMIGVFVALDFFLFYIFWEVMLLPMYFLIGVWGGPRKEYAAIKFFIYTLAGSVLMLVRCWRSTSTPPPGCVPSTSSRWPAIRRSKRPSAARPSSAGSSPRPCL